MRTSVKAWLLLGVIHLRRPLENRVFDPPSPVHMHPHEPDLPSPLWMSTCHRHEIHIALQKQLVQWPSGSKDEMRLKYHCNCLKLYYYFFILLVYILTKNFHFLFCPKTKFWSKKNANFFAWEEDRMTSVGYNFLCGHPHGADTPIHRLPHEPNSPPPLCGRH